MSNMRAWRDSATLILAARQSLKIKHSQSNAAVCQYDYKLLSLKRHQDATFMPGSYVFPGGTAEPSDADSKWNRLFLSSGFDKNSFASLFVSNSKRPPIFESRQNELPGEISLRITAIRETFEECGILMCRKVDKNCSSTEIEKDIADKEMRDWQEKVHEDPTEFFRMCESLKCYPDLWALHEWSNWLTPTFMKKRFDTIFFTACLPTQPNGQFESKEMQDLKWEDPESLLCPLNDYNLPPPQQFEVARIAQYKCLDDLKNFAVIHGQKGVNLNMPVKITLSDGNAHVMPGDSMYPEDISLTEIEIIDRTHQTLSEFRDISPVKNRIEYHKTNGRTLIVDNFDAVDSHLTRFSVETVHSKPT